MLQRKLPECMFEGDRDRPIAAREEHLWWQREKDLSRDRQQRQWEIVGNERERGGERKRLQCKNSNDKENECSEIDR